MNLRKTCPDIPDDWKGGITDVARILGGDRPLSRQTVMRYIRLGHKNGGMKATLNASGFLPYFRQGSEALLEQTVTGAAVAAKSRKRNKPM